MADPISMNDTLVYAALGDRPKGAPDYIGVFIQNGRPLPVMFEGDQASVVYETMDAWLRAEREKAARREMGFSVGFVFVVGCLVIRIYQAVGSHEDALRNQYDPES